MENKNSLSFERATLATLDIILAKIGKRLESAFDPEDTDSMKLLREYRSTLHCRRAWAKEYSLLDENSQQQSAPAKKEEIKPVINPPQINKPPVLMEKNTYPPLDESIFKGIRFKKNPLPQPDMNSGLLCHR